MRRVRGWLFAAAVGGALTASALTIDRTWCIACPDEGEPVICAALKTAALEIQRDLAEVYAFTLSIVPASKAHAPAIWLGEAAAQRAGLLPDDLTAFQNVIAAQTGNLYLFGRDCAGRKGLRPDDWFLCAIPTARAAARFLRDYAGVMFLMPGETGVEVTRKGKGCVAIGDGLFDRENPAQICGSGRHHGLMYDMANNIFGRGTEWTYGGHSYPDACPISKYGKTHPEYFGLLGGKRIVPTSGYSAVLCVSNPDVQQLMVDELCRRFDAGADACQLGQQDGFRGCECAACAAIGGGGLDWGERLWVVHRGIAERLAKLRPGKIVHIMAYGPTAHPPKTFKAFPDNVMIELCSYSEAAFAEWEAFAVPRGFTVYTYLWGDYPRVGFTAKHSFPHLALLARRFRRHGVRGIYRCGYGELFGTEGPAYYVFNTLLEKPEADVTQLVADYCRAAFGPACVPMLTFYEQLNLQLQPYSLASEGWPAQAGVGLGAYRAPFKGSSLPFLAYIYTPDAIATLEAALTRAEQSAGLSEKAKRRLALVRLEWDYAKNLGRIATRYMAYQSQSTRASFDALADAIRVRNRFLDALYPAGAKTPRKIPGWPELDAFGGFDRAMLFTNGRLGATVHAPLNWNVDRIAQQGALPGVVEKRMRAVRTHETPARDDFAAGVWAKAAWQPLVGGGGQKLDKAGRVKVLYDDSQLYIAIESDLADEKRVKAAGRDGAIWSDECAEMVIAPAGKRECAYHFIVNPNDGALYDAAYGLIDDPLHPKFRLYDTEWNAKGVEIANRRAKGRWSLYMRLPYSDIGAKPPARGEAWGVNFNRTWWTSGNADKPILGYWNANLESGADFASPKTLGKLVFE